jgi:hypothetical protein
LNPRAIASALLVLAAGARAYAQEAAPVESSALLEQGVQRRIEHRDDEARALFARAWDACHCGEALAQMALAEQALGRWAAAERHLTDAMAMDEPWIARNRAVLADSLAEIGRHLATIEVRIDPHSATLTLSTGESTRADSTGFSRLRVVPGETVVRAEAAGFMPAAQTAATIAGETSRIEFTLVPAVPPRAATVPTESPNASDRRWIIGAGFATGASVLFVAGAAIAWGFEQSAVRAYNDDSRCLVGSRTRDQNCGDDLAHLQQAAGIAAGGLALAALSGALSGVLWWRGLRRTASPVLSFDASPTAIGIRFERAF